MDRQDERRLWLMTLLRLVGLAVVIAGLGLAAGSAGSLPRLASGLVLMAGGLLLFLAGPRALLRHWRRSL